MPDNKNDDVLNDLLSGNDEDVRWIAEDLEHIVYRTEEERTKHLEATGGPDVDELEEMRGFSEQLTLKSHEVGDRHPANADLDAIRGLTILFNKQEFNVIDVGPRGLTICFGGATTFGVGQPLRGMELNFKGRRMALNAEVLFVAKDADRRQLCGLRILHDNKEKESRLLDLLIKYKDQFRNSSKPAPQTKKH